VVATSIFGLMPPESPDQYRWETWWYYAQGGPGIFKGDLYFYSVDSDYRNQVQKISGKVPIYFLTGDYDFACTPEMTERTADKVKNAECIIFTGGHFPTSEDPVKFKEVITPVLKKILQLDPERRGQPTGLAGRTNVTELRSTSGGQRPAGGRRVIEL
jgi:pimeloyl-ACP methyl ester carboxylesterase